MKKISIMFIVMFVVLSMKTQALATSPTPNRGNHKIPLSRPSSTPITIRVDQNHNEVPNETINITTSSTPAQVYFELFYLEEKSNDEIIKGFEQCSTEVLENIMSIENYYNSKADKGEAEIKAAIKEYYEKHPELGGADYSQWEVIKPFMQRSFENYRPSILTILSARQQGTEPGGQDDERASEIAEQIKQLYEGIKNDITSADQEILDQIGNLMVELYRTDSGERDIYNSGEMLEIRAKVREELRRRNPDNLTPDEQIVVNETQLANELQGGLANRVGTKPPDELASYVPNDKNSPDDIIDEGSDFLTTGKENQGNVTMNGEKVQTTSDLLFNLAFAVGVGVAVIIGTYLGIKFMLGGAEEKANIKETLLPYIMGVIIMFASFSIWKLVLVLLQAIDNI